MRFSLKLAQSAQPGEKHSKFSTENKNLGLGVTFWGKTPPKGISNQNTLLNNFSSVQPRPTYILLMQLSTLHYTELLTASISFLFSRFIESPRRFFSRLTEQMDPVYFHACAKHEFKGQPLE
jgi:hypothetical protein